MKKLYILLTFLSTTLAASLTAQSSFQIFETSSGTNITGDTVDVTGQPTDVLLEYAAVVQNTSGNTLTNVNVTRSYDLQPAGMTASFCWGPICYPSFVDTSSTPATIGPGMTDSTFRADAHPNFNSGILMATYTVFDGDNPSDFATVTVRFLVGVTSIDENSLYTLSGVYPNPARNFINFDYELNNGVNAQIEVYDLSGKKVKNISLSPNNTHLKEDVSSLYSGVYVYTLSVNGKAVLTKRLVISK